MESCLKKIGLRERQVLLVLLIALPLSIVIALQSNALRREKTAVVFAEATALALKVAAYPKEIIPEPRTYLQNLSRLHEATTKDSCILFLNAVLKVHPYFTTVAVLSPTGERVCPPSLRSEKDNLSDREYFQRLLATKTYTISGLLTGNQSHKKSIIFAQPLLDEHGQIKQVFLLGLEAQWLSESLNEVVSSMRLPEGTIAVVVDNNGIMVARAPYLPGSIGTYVPDWTTARELLTKTSNLTREEVWRDGVHRATVYVPIFDSPNGSLRMRVGIPIEPALKQMHENNVHHVIFVAFVVLAALTLAWVTSERLVLKPIRALSSAAEALAQGNFSTRVGNIGSTRELSQLATAFDSMATRIQNKREQLDFFALNDPLTGLPNRYSITTHLARAIQVSLASGKSIGVLLLGLDGFKSIKDSLGHQLGEQVLMEIAKVLAAGIDGSTLLGRAGDDEFAVVTENVKGRTDFVKLAKSLKEEIRRPINVGAHQFFISASVGIAIFPDHGKDADTLLQHANVAMCRAKAQKSSTYCFYDPRMNELALARLKMQNLLSQAVTRGELILHYQPKIAISSRKITGAEALVRWQSTELGFVSPGDFIPLAEQTGLIVEIGEWVLQAACAQLKEWKDQVCDEFTMAVNLSSRQVTDPGLVGKISGMLDNAGIPAHQLELEITEGTLMYNPGEAIEVLNALRSFGIKISVDDFGTGYSSLAYLKHLPIDAIKIDRAFIKDITDDNCDRTIVSAVVGIAKERGLRVTAEGIESAQQLSAIESLGCHEYQGYFFSRPLAAPDFLEMLLL